MIRKVEIKNFRILKDIKLELKPFHILIGANATGKSTFLDAIALVRDVLNDGIERAVEKRAFSFSDLLWDKNNPIIEINLELQLPEDIKNIYINKNLSAYTRSRYELIIGINRENEELQILEERVWLKGEDTPSLRETDFPLLFDDLISSKKRRRVPSNWRKVVAKSLSGNDSFWNEFNRYHSPSKTGSFKSALANLPEDNEKYPSAVWTKHKLKEGIQCLTLNSLVMRQPCHPGKKRIFEMDGSNLPIMVRELGKRSKKQFNSWIAHLKTALPFLQTIKVKAREEDRFLYLIIKDQNNRNIPSWLLSDGTLRILALTLLAYLPNNEGIYLIEEPENGVHPLAVEAIYQSLSSVYSGQVLVATHSPVLLSVAKLDEILCFSRKDTGEAEIISGDKHPALKDWKGDPNLDILYGSGVLD